MGEIPLDKCFLATMLMGFRGKGKTAAIAYTIQAFVQVGNHIAAQKTIWRISR